MIKVIKKYLGYDNDTQTTDKGDDFADFFYNAKASDKKKLMMRVMQRATKEQLSVIEKDKTM